VPIQGRDAFKQFIEMEAMSSRPGNNNLAILNSHIHSIS